MVSPVTSSHLTLKGEIQGRSDLEALYLVKEQNVGRHVLLLNIKRKAYMGSQMTLSHLTLKGQILGLTLAF